MRQRVKRAEMSLIFLGIVIVKSEKSTKNRLPGLGKTYSLSEESGTAIT